MIPRRPPQSGQVGFLYIPPWRVQGISVAGEQTVVQVPELDVVFDIGLCPRIALASPNVALSHSHMDHVAGLPYYFSQRMFQKMGTGRCICHAAIAPTLRSMMNSWVELERQRTKHEILGLEPDGEVAIKPGIMLRGVETSHTVPSLGYALIEHRNKLREEFFDRPQQELRDLRTRGVEVTRTIQIPLVAYTGDTEFGPWLLRDEFTKAKVVISECTFFEPEHRSRANIGKHLHVEHLRDLLETWEAETIVLIHLSRRTSLDVARNHVEQVLGEAQASRILFLMDHRANRLRYDRQAAEGSGTPGGVATHG